MEEGFAPIENKSILVVDPEETKIPIDDPPSTEDPALEEDEHTPNITVNPNQPYVRRINDWKYSDSPIIDNDDEELKAFEKYSEGVVPKRMRHNHVHDLPKGTEMGGHMCWLETFEECQDETFNCESRVEGEEEYTRWEEAKNWLSSEIYPIYDDFKHNVINRIRYHEHFDKGCIVFSFILGIIVGFYICHSL